MIHLPTYYPFVIKHVINGTVHDYATVSTDHIGYMEVVIPESASHENHYGAKSTQLVSMDDYEIIQRWNGKEYVGL